MLISILISFLVVVSDQVTKYLADKFLAPLESLPILKGIFHLTLTHNKGAAFSILQGGAIFFVIVSILCIGAIIFMLSRPRFLKSMLGFEAADKIIQVSLGLILGGACGNLLDRLRFGYVIDFLDFQVWPVFNMADSCITIGAILIGWKMFFGGRKKEK